MKTLLLDRGADEGILNRWHNHALNGDVSRKHYNRSQYMDQKREIAAALTDLMSQVRAVDPESTQPPRKNATAIANRPSPVAEMIQN